MSGLWSIRNLFSVLVSFDVKKFCRVAPIQVGVVEVHGLETLAQMADRVNRGN